LYRSVAWGPGHAEEKGLKDKKLRRLEIYFSKEKYMKRSGAALKTQ
jgi:hypothetical protein